LAAATAAAVPTAASQGIEDLSYLAGYFLDAGIALFHPGKDLPDILAVLSNLVHLSEDNLAQGSDHPSHFSRRRSSILAPTSANRAAVPFMWSRRIRARPASVSPSFGLGISLVPRSHLDR
jgi:hypothetical protein